MPATVAAVSSSAPASVSALVLAFVPESVSFFLGVGDRGLEFLDFLDFLDALDALDFLDVLDSLDFLASYEIFAQFAGKVCQLFHVIVAKPVPYVLAWQHQRTEYYVFAV